MSMSTRKIRIRITSKKELDQEINEINALLDSFEKRFASLNEEKRQYLDLKGFCLDSETPFPLNEIPALKSGFEMLSSNVKKFDDDFFNSMTVVNGKLPFHSDAFQSKCRETLGSLAKSIESLFLFVNNEKSLYVEEKKVIVTKIIIPTDTFLSPESKSVRISPTGGKPE